MADQWYVYKRKTSNVCTVQHETERPHLGEQHLGPYKSKAEATRAMCADLDASMEDPTHCWEVSPAGACASPAESLDQREDADASEEVLSRLSLAEVKAKIARHNNSGLSPELIMAVCWAESSFDPAAVATAPSTSRGLMMMNKAAVDTVNRNTPAGVHFDHADMTDADQAIACGSWYLKIIFNDPKWGKKDKRETLRAYRGVADYVYADKVLACEGCLQSTVVVDPQTCLNQIHTLADTAQNA